MCAVVSPQRTDRRRRPETEDIWGTTSGDRLFEREDFLWELHGVLAGTWEHPTGAIVVEGAPGTGKTAMVNAGCHLAHGLDLRVVRARAAESETDVPFGLIRRLLRPIVPPHEADEGAWSRDTELATRLLRSGTVQGADWIEVFHSLDSLLSQLGTSPTLLAVDDVHWADAESAAWLQFMARRLETNALRMLLSTRPRRAGVPLCVADRLVSEPSTRVFLLQPLSRQVVCDLVSGYLGEPSEASFVDGCHEITGGNPYLLMRLLHELDLHAVRPVARCVSALQTISSPTVAGSVLERLTSVGSGALRLLQAVAVLGADADLRVAAALAGIDGDDAGRIADRLADVYLLRSGRPLAFVHQFVRSSVYSEIPPARQSSMHAEAAQLAAASGHGAEETAVHLLETEPRSNPWVVSELTTAARAALDRDDARSAAQYQRRASAEPPSVDQRCTVLQIQAEVEGALGHSEAVEHFREARRQGADVVEWVSTGLRLVERLWNTPRAASIVDLLRTAKDEFAARDREGLTRLELVETVIPSEEPMPRRVDVRLAPLTGSYLTMETTTGRLAVAYAAAASAADPSNSKVDEIVEVIRTALTPGDIASGSDGLAASVITQALGVLVQSGHGDVAEPILRAAKLGADNRGEVSHSSAFAVTLGKSLLLRGQLRDAEELAQGVLGRSRDVDALTRECAKLLWIQILATRGDLAGARKAIADIRVDEWKESGLFDGTSALETRGHLHLLTRQWDMALEDFECSGKLADEQGILNPALTSWRVGKCQALVELGRIDEAIELSDANLHLARQFGSPVQIAEALRCAARLASGPDQIARLAEAVDSLTDTSAQLERCRGIIELGRARREAGDPVAARPILRLGGDLAVRLGAGLLADMASDELRAAGARPRRLPLSGAGALTPAERRVYLLATQGRTNSMIASSLFVSVKTVECHLTRSYRKLGVKSRAELPDLQDPDAHPT